MSGEAEIETCNVKPALYRRIGGFYLNCQDGVEVRSSAVDGETGVRIPLWTKKENRRIEPEWTWTPNGSTDMDDIAHGDTRHPSSSLCQREMTLLE